MREFADTSERKPSVLNIFAYKHLMHEVYHHMSHRTAGTKHLKRKAEEAAAELWGQRAVGHVFRNLYNSEQAKQEWHRIAALVDGK